MHFERTNKKDYGQFFDSKDHYVIEVAFTQTPKPKRQIEILQSPLFYQVQKDLFSQLLGSDAKESGSPLMLLGWSNRKSENLTSAVKEEDFELEEKMDEEFSNENSEENEDHYTLDIKEDLLRKRRRKSTAQLKALKQQFDKRQGEWSKQKIVKMAQLTGLSQSQVYKWCWDQKKKNQLGGKFSQTLEAIESQIQSQFQKSSSTASRTKFIHKKFKEVRTKRKQYECALRVRNQTVRKRE